MEEQLVQKIIEFLESASPRVWEAAQRQVISQVAILVIWSVICVVAIAILWRLALRAHRARQREIAVGKTDSYLSVDWDDSGPWWTKFLSVTVAIALVLIVASNATGIIIRMINPTYYAISILIRLVQ